MNGLNRFYKFTSLLLAVILMASTFVMTVSAAEGDDPEATDPIYTFHRDGNGQKTYLYQSPCMLLYDINNETQGAGTSVQAFLYTMYNTVSGEHFPTYCTDINVSATPGAYYRRMNLEYSPFAGDKAGHIRAILQNGFYIIPDEGETADAHATRVAKKTEELGEAAGVDNLTTGEAIAATQAAIWQAAHGWDLSFLNFCSIVFKPTFTTYVDLCYTEYFENIDKMEQTQPDEAIQAKKSVSERIGKVYSYLLSLPPVPAEDKVVSASSILKMENPVLSEPKSTEDGTYYDVSVDVIMDVDLIDGTDLLYLWAELGNSKSADTPEAGHPLKDGKQIITLTIPNVPEEEAKGKLEIDLFVQGTQTVSGFFFFEAKEGHTKVQSMVGYNDSQQNVYFNLTALPKEPPTTPPVQKVGVNLQKVDADDHNTPLHGATFELYRKATEDEITADTGLHTIPGYDTPMVKVSFYDNPEMTGEKVTFVTTGADGEISICGVPYGTYYLLETEAPDGYNLMAAPMELKIDADSYLYTEINPILVENESGTLLPNTGGIGTTVYTVSGMTLLCGACLFLYMNKRKATEA